MSFINMEKHREAQEAGLIVIKKHPEYDLYIHNYREICQFRKKWDEVTLMSRGLITTGEGKIVARPFKKFFNIQEYSELPDEPFKVFDKLDGSLGILYRWDSKWLIATRGSFDSEQAVAATRILNEKYGDVNFDEGATYLFEIILPENQIVINYGGMRDLILIAKVDIASGKDVEFTVDDSRFRIVEQYDGLTKIDEIKAAMKGDYNNHEGFVLLFESGLRVKAKFEQYVKLHALRTNVTQKRIINLVRTGADIGKLLEEQKIPDEMFTEIGQKMQELTKQFQFIKEDATTFFHKHKMGTKRESAKEFCRYKYPNLLWMQFDDKKIDDHIWTILEKIEKN